MIFVVDEDLLNATKQGDLEKVKNALVENGVSPNACFETLMTPTKIVKVFTYINIFFKKRLLILIMNLYIFCICRRNLC